MIWKEERYICAEMWFSKRMCSLFRTKIPVLQRVEHQVTLRSLDCDPIQGDDSNNISVDEENLEDLGFFDLSEQISDGNSPQISQTGESSPPRQEVPAMNLGVLVETDQPHEVRKYERARIVPNKFKDFVYKIPGVQNESDQSTSFTIHIVKEMKNHSLDYIACMSEVIKMKEPNRYEKAQGHPGWEAAMEEEFQAMEKNGT